MRQLHTGALSTILLYSVYYITLWCLRYNPLVSCTAFPAVVDGILKAIDEISVRFLQLVDESDSQQTQPAEAADTASRHFQELSSLVRSHGQPAVLAPLCSH